MRWWAKLIGRTHLFWVIGWPLAALLVWLPAPRLASLLHGDATDFLPASMPSKQAARKLLESFPDYAYASRVAIVCTRDGPLSAEDRSAVGRIALALDGQHAQWNWRVRSAATLPWLQSFLESEDGHASLILVELPADMLTHHTVERVRQLQQIAAEQDLPAGLGFEITGGGALGELLDANAKRDVDATTAWAFATVAAVLLMVYRSPVAMLLPVATIAFSLMVSMGLVGWAAKWWLPINGLVEMFVVVIVAGTGVDYCLFLFARFRESISAGESVQATVELAIGRTGGAILASAGTNAAALTTLLLARNRDFYTSGPTIAFCIVVATLAVFTFTPSLMWLLGRRLLWPTGDLALAQRVGRFWSTVARWTTSRPLTVSLSAAGLLLIPAIWAIGARPLYDAIEEYPPDSSFVRGARLYEQHFRSSQPSVDLTLLLETPKPIGDDAAIATLSRMVGDLASELADEFAIVEQRDLGQPLGRSRKLKDAGPDGETPLFGLFSPSAIAERFMRSYYLGSGGRVTRIDLTINAIPRSQQAIDLVPEVRARVSAFLSRSEDARELGFLASNVLLGGESATYNDIRELRTGDFRRVALAALVIIALIVLAVVRSVRCTILLIAATVLTYLAAYGCTWLIFTRFAGVEGLSYQLDFLLFIIIVSLGQDYNLYVVTRIREEMLKRPLREAVAESVRKTGRVVSSCGVIMACAFGSMYAGSLLLMKEFAVALALGMLIDTFVVRPLLVPAAFVLLHPRKGQRSPGSEERRSGHVHGIEG